MKVYSSGVTRLTKCNICYFTYKDFLEVYFHEHLKTRALYNEDLSTIYPESLYTSEATVSFFEEVFATWS
jgi:CRP-like cAMP-binding protein